MNSRTLPRVVILLVWLVAAWPAHADQGASDPRPCWEAEWQNALEHAAAASASDREYLATLAQSECRSLAKLAKILLQDGEAEDTERLKTPIEVERGQPDWSRLDLENERVLAPGLLLRLTIDSRGRVQKVEIEKGSGNAKVDALCVEALRRSLFRPARELGRFTESELMISVHIHVR